MEYLFSAFHFQSVSLFWFEGSLLKGVHSAILCLFRGALNPFTLNVVIDKYVFIAILLIFSGCFYSCPLFLSPSLVVCCFTSVLCLCSLVFVLCLYFVGVWLVVIMRFLYISVFFCGRRFNLLGMNVLVLYEDYICTLCDLCYWYHILHLFLSLSWLLYFFWPS